MVIKIAFGCTMGVGKDICCDYLIQKYTGQKISFADPIYKILNYAQNICGFPEQKDRKFLQFIGNEWARNIDSDIWIKLALENSKKYDCNLFCTDVRYLNELISLKNNGWICIKLNRNNIEINREGTGSTNHPSEKGIDDSYWNFVIDNNGKLNELYEKLDNIIEKCFIYI